MRIHRGLVLVISLGIVHCSSGRTGSSSDNGSSDNGSNVKVGDVCIPTNELDPAFSGFHVTEETIEKGAPACGDGVCLVNHFQGRVTCPEGQKAPTPCSGPSDVTSCGAGASCVQAGGAFVCHTPGACQTPNLNEPGNQGKACCVPDTDTPVTTAVCGQCSPVSSRNSTYAVYCSCRCGPPEGEPEDENADYCKCPAGFECHEIRKNLGIGDPDLPGKYCIRQGSAYIMEQMCGQVSGFYNSQTCKGFSTGS